MRVTISGPNLPRPLCDKGDMHVHAEGCADLRRYPQGIDQGGWHIDVDTKQDVVEAVYGDQIAESDLDWPDYLGDLYWAPCTDDLPEHLGVVKVRRTVILELEGTEEEVTVDGQYLVEAAGQLDSVLVVDDDLVAVRRSDLRYVIDALLDYADPSGEVEIDRLTTAVEEG